VQVVIAGGSGFLGRALLARLHEQRHSVAVLTRQARTDAQETIRWTPDGIAGGWARKLDGVDAVVNLAGEGIADRRWTAARKEALSTSRLLTTRSLVAAMREVTTPPAVFVNASACGYYGSRGDEILTESSSPGSDFLADLCVEWEREAEAAAPLTRVVLLRTGLTLHPRGGALQKMLLPFRLGIGGPFGSGEQFMAWIHLEDWVALVIWLLTDVDARGAFNLTAPEPVTNAEFARALGRALHRPAVLRVPAFALRLLLGELAESLLTGQRAIPDRALKAGFQFQYPRLDKAMEDLIRPYI
jgi:uncharacterized protein (TIGR01777 family)